MELAIILALVLLNGIFAMSEMALVASRKFKLESAKKRGSQGAKTALELSENPTRFLSTVQIGITLIGILLGVYSGENLTTDLAALVRQYAPLAPYAEGLATGLVVLLVTYLSIVLGELLPKRIGMVFPEAIITALARPMRWLSFLTSPFVWLLTASNNLILRIMGIDGVADSRVSEEEIKSIIKESAEGGEIQDIEQDIVERVFELGDRRVNSLMTHRSDIVFFTFADSLEDIKRKARAEKHSAYPVSKGQGIDEVAGIVLLKDLFSIEAGPAFNIAEHLRQPVYFDENAYAFKVLEAFKAHKMHYGLIFDEYGVLQGMVTMDDVVDALVGDVSEEGHDEYKITPREDGSWLVDGQYAALEFLKFFDIALDAEDEDRFATVAGLMIFKMGNIPSVGQKMELAGYILEVVDKDRQRIDKVLVTRR